MDYDNIAKGYDELHREEQRKKLKIIKENIKIKKDNLLLDVGCGTGLSSDFDCKVTGLDPSKNLLKINKNKDVILGKVESIPFEDNTFDIVISITAIHNFDDIEKGLKEMKRVGKDKFVFSVLKKSKKLKLIERLIKKYFKVKKIIEEEKDIIFFA